MLKALFYLGCFLLGTARADELHPIDPDGIEPQRASPQITVINIRPLTFSMTFAGESAETVPPVRNGTGDAALFLIQGRPYTSVVVLIPDDEIILTGPSRDRGRKTLFIKRLKSYPEAGQPFNLNANGSASVSVGGTRERLPSNQATGDYEGRFFLTVMYQ